MRNFFVEQKCTFACTGQEDNLESLSNISRLMKESLSTFYFMRFFYHSALHYIHFFVILLILFREETCVLTLQKQLAANVNPVQQTQLSIQEPNLLADYSFKKLKNAKKYRLFHSTRCKLRDTSFFAFYVRYSTSNPRIKSCLIYGTLKIIWKSSYKLRHCNRKI